MNYFVMEHWPNLFIVGASKAGTTSLYNYLNQIPEIYMSTVKEPNFFSVKTVGEKHPVKPIRDKTKYLRLFDKGKNFKYIGEASPTYLSDYDAALQIHQVSPKSKIIICLRDPVERVYSHYLMLHSNGMTHLSLNEQLKKEMTKNPDINLPHLRLQVGFYSKWITMYQNIFSKSQIKILIFEDFIKNPKQAMEEILRFLNIETRLTDFSPEVHNPYGVIKNPIAQKIRQSKIAHTFSNKFFSKPQKEFLKEKLIFSQKTKPLIDEESKDKLIKYYFQDVQILETILDKKLPWPNFHR
jgi:hypothetical protein